jgi:hypothetical protein
LAADENFNSDIVRGLVRRKPDLDIVRVQDAGLSGADDAAVLDGVAKEGRVLVTAYDRVRTARQMPGVFEVSPRVPIGRAIDDLVLIVECSLEGEREGQVRYLPL